MTVLPRPGRSNALAAWAVFAVTLGVYSANGDFLPGNDSKPNVYLPISILREGNPTFTPDEMPFMFVWEESRRESSPTDPRGPIGNGKGRGRLVGEKYYVVPTVREGVARGCGVT